MTEELFAFVCVAIVIACLWKLFVKADQPGWAAIIPIYNLYVLTQIVGKPVWWVIACMIPFVNFYFIPWLLFHLAKVFGKGDGFGLGLFFLPFMFFPVLAFGGAKYQGKLAQA